jgi:cytochrome P450
LVEVPQWTTHRSEINFRDPDEFIPERWLPADHVWYLEKYQNDNKGVVQSFAFGPRSCLGKKYDLLTTPASF